MKNKVMKKDNTDMSLLLNKVNTKEASEAIAIAVEIADLICFHAKCRENGIAMMEPWNE